MENRILYKLVILFFGIFGIGILVLVLVENKAGACDRSKQEFLKMEYSGEIKRTYRSKNHGHWMTVFEDGTEKALLFDYKIWAGLKPGDILIKKKNELNFILIRGEDSTRYQENIPDCEQFKVE